MLLKNNQGQQIREIEAQLSEVRGFIARVNQIVGPYKDFQLPPLLTEEKRLANELKAANLLSNDTALQVVVEGAPVENHSLAIEFFGPLLVEIQKFINAIAQELQGKTKRQGRFNQQVKIQNKLFVVPSVMPTSFGVNLRVRPTDQVSIFDLDDENDTPWKHLPDALNIFHQYFDGNADVAVLSEVVGVPRIRQHYEKILTLLANNSASLEVRSRRHPLPVQINSAQATSRKVWINTFQNDIQRREVIGVLSGGNVRRQTFEIEPDDGSSLISGTANDYATFGLKRISLGSRVVADVMVITERHESAEVGYNTKNILRLIEKIEDVVVQ